MKFMFDDDYLYISAHIRDDVFFQPAVGGGTWIGDGFQFSFGVNGDYVYEMMASLTSEGPQLYMGGRHDNVGFVKGAKIAVKRYARYADYEIALPWNQIKPLTPSDGKIKMNFILNDNDGAGRVGYLECKPGIGKGKFMSQSYSWPLVEQTQGEN